VHMRAPLERVGFEEKPYNNMVRLAEPAIPSVDLMDGDYVRRHTLRWIDHLPPGGSFMGLDATDLQRPRAEVARGTATLSDVTVRTASVRFRIDAATETLVRVNIYRFPGWVVRVDGKEVPLVDASRRRRVLFFNVLPGTHEVSVDFERTPARRLGDSLTLAGLAGLGLLGVLPWREPQA